MKKNVKELIITSLIVLGVSFTNIYSCSAKPLDEISNEIPVTGTISLVNNSIAKDDIQINCPVPPSFNSDKNLIDIPKTGDMSTSIYWLILILALLILIYQYRKEHKFNKEVQ